jgi:23S rRNA (uracil1939-C5)-methyltransferase
LLEQSGSPDVVVVDPPRAGLSQKVVRRIIEAERERVVYVSCNPTTLAPNARQLVDDGGYELGPCARSTCSRRRRTSSAWRCWSAG